MSNTSNTLEGQYFHAISDGAVCWFGSVIGSPEPGYYLVEILSWLDTSAMHRRLVPIEDMMGWFFYQDRDQMIQATQSGEVCNYSPFCDELEPPYLKHDHSN